MLISDWSSDVCSSDLLRTIGSHVANLGLSRRVTVRNPDSRQPVYFDRPAWAAPIHQRHRTMTITVAVDSFTTLDDADDYFSARLHATAWDEADAATRERSLKMATAILNRETFCGRITDQTQALAWPRTGAAHGEGRRLEERESVG